MTVPAVVKTVLDSIEYDNEEIEQISSGELIFNGKLVIPDEQWDWTEALNFLEAINLRCVFECSLLSGPRTQIFEKIDPTKPGYVILSGYDYESKFYWIEWK